VRVVFVVSDLLQPLDRFPVKLFDDCDMRHGGRGSRAVPVFLTGRTPDHVARMNFLDRTSPALYDAAAGRHDQRLPEWMNVPRCTSARLECDADTERACRLVCLK